MNPLDNLLLTFELIRSILYFSFLKVSALLLLSSWWAQGSFSKLNHFYSVSILRKRNSDAFSASELDLELQEV
jgi:hypothetical protein